MKMLLNTGVCFEIQHEDCDLIRKRWQDSLSNQEERSLCFFLGIPACIDFL